MSSQIIKPADNIVNGYFYTFVYKPVSYGSGSFVDSRPIIYCIGPSITNKNNFRAINFNHLPMNVKKELLYKMIDAKEIDKVRAIFTEDEINSLVPGSKIAVREYSRTRIYQPKEIARDQIVTYVLGNEKISIFGVADKNSGINFYNNKEEKLDN